MRYIQVQIESDLQSISISKPFRSIVVVEKSIDLESQSQICNWLVKSGCLYMMAWGENCSSWDDAIDQANLEEFDYGEIPEEQFVMSTWHENESLKEVFWYSKHSAIHPAVEINNTLLLHVSSINREQEYSDEYKQA